MIFRYRDISKLGREGRGGGGGKGEIEARWNRLGGT